MTKKDFVRERKLKGKIAEELEPTLCEHCDSLVIPVATRREPLMYLLFEPDERGELHKCRKTRADAG